MDKKVVVIDDVQLNIRLLREILEDEGYKVYGICDNINKDTVEIIASIMPDIILLDVMMPGISGYELCQCIKKNKSTQHIPIIMLTALTEKGTIEKAFEAGAQGFLNKPFEEEDVLMLLRIGPKVEQRCAVQVEQHSTQSFCARDVLQKLKGNIAFYHDSICSFEQNTTAFLMELKECLNTRDKAGAAQKSHTLKGILLYFGAVYAVELMVQIETALKNDAYLEAERLYNELKREIANITSLLFGLLEQLDTART